MADAKSKTVEALDGTKVKLPTEPTNSEEAQHIPGVPGLFKDGKEVKPTEPKPIGQLVDEQIADQKLEPGADVPLPPSGTHIASGQPQRVAPAPDEGESG